MKALEWGNKIYKIGKSMMVHYLDTTDEELPFFGWWVPVNLLLYLIALELLSGFLVGDNLLPVLPRYWIVVVLAVVMIIFMAIDRKKTTSGSRKEDD